MLTALTTLSSRRLALTVRTPRELVVPLMTPIMFALVIAPALNEATGGLRSGGGIDYEAFVALATVGLLIPLNMMFSGIAVIVDREAGARRELLAAPIPRWLLVAGNLAVALGVTALQVGTLLLAAIARGVDLSTTASGAAWFAAAAMLFAVGLYGVAETLANRMPGEAEYIAAVPAIAIVPWFFAGSLFPIGALPAVLTAVAKVLPLTHALAVMRYGLIDHDGAGLHDIWGGGDPAVLAACSLGVVALFALATTVLAIRTFNRKAIG